MVLRQAFCLVAGVGLASLAAHVVLTQTIQQQRRDLARDFRAQRDVLFHKRQQEFK